MLMIPTREALQTICTTTVAEVEAMDTRQKVGVGLANVMSLSRIAAAAPLVTKPDHERWTWNNASQAAAVPVSDCADGVLARAFNARTTAGGYLDQTLDKVVLLALEAKLVARSEMSAEDFMQRLASDDDINEVRTRITTLSKGEVNVDALKPGKRLAVMRFAEKIICMSPLANNHPRAVRLMQRYVTKKLITTREQSKAIYRQRYNEWLQQQEAHLL